MERLLAGVERELRSTASTNTGVALRQFRARLDEVRVVRERKQFERELKDFLQSKPHLRRAATGYIREMLPPIVKAAIAALKHAQQVAAQQKAKKLG
jgi:hypothetical protein